MDNDRADLPVRSPVPDVASAPASTSQDENDYSTLVQLEIDLTAEFKKLQSVDAFTLDEGKLSVKEQLAAYKKAQEILEPALEMVRSAVRDVKKDQVGK